MKNKLHTCVDYCQPPEHADLAFSAIDCDDPVANHSRFENDYWHRFGVVVIKVERLPEWDGRSPDKGFAVSLVTGKPMPERKTDSSDRAFIVRWRDDIEREHDWRKREAAICGIYEKGK